jgi:hypothetical protein
MKKNKKEVNNPTYHNGKYTGYRLIDGKYHIATTYIDQFAVLAHKSEGINVMLSMVTRHASQDLEEISRARQIVWDKIADDIGIDLKSNKWTYINGVISKIDMNSNPKES